MELKDKLITLRKESGYTQSALAEKMDVSRQAISSWELGETVPSLEKLMRLGELYGVSVDYLVNGSGLHPAAVAVAEKPEEKAEKYRWRKPAFIGVAVGLAIAAVIALFVLTYHAGYGKGVEDTTPTSHPIHTEKVDKSDIEGAADLIGW